MSRLCLAPTDQGKDLSGEQITCVEVIVNSVGRLFFCSGGSVAAAATVKIAAL